MRADTDRKVQRRAGRHSIDQRRIDLARGAELRTSQIRPLSGANASTGRSDLHISPRKNGPRPNVSKKLDIPTQEKTSSSTVQRRWRQSCSSRWRRQVTPEVQKPKLLLKAGLSDLVMRWASIWRSITSRNARACSPRLSDNVSSV